jgi:hypothetical protein
MRLIIPMIIQTIGLDPSGAVWTDEASNVSRLDRSGADQVDAEHPTPSLSEGRGSGSAWGMAAPPSWDTQPYRQVQAPELRRLVRR